MNRRRQGMVSVESLLLIAVGALILVGLTQYWQTNLGPQSKKLAGIVIGQEQKIGSEIPDFQFNRPSFSILRPDYKSPDPWESDLAPNSPPNQFLGLFKGFGEAGVDLVKGIWDLVAGTGKLTVGWWVAPEEAQKTWDHLKATVAAIKKNPGLLVDALTRDIVDDWKAGRKGEAIGRGLFAVGEILVGSKGAGKVGKIGKVEKAPKRVDKWSRAPKSLQDRLTLEAAKSGKGIKIIDNLGDPKFKGMEKWEYKVKSVDGRDSVVHYVRDPETGRLMDFKFQKHSTD